jgi:hypothetical protein
MNQDLFPDAPIWDEGLTGRQRRFVEAYCTDKTCFLNATAAFIKAYSRDGQELAESSIQSNSSRLMRNEKIKGAITKFLRSKQSEDDKLAEYQVLKLLHTLTFYNPADIIDKDGRLKVKDINELGDLALCVTEIRRGKFGTEIKLFDRTKALNVLAEYLKLIRPPESQGGSIPIIFLTKKELSDADDDGEPKINPAGSGEALEAEVLNTEQDE